jgi:hypothetical protein
VRHLLESDHHVLHELFHILTGVLINEDFIIDVLKCHTIIKIEKIGLSLLYKLFKGLEEIIVGIHLVEVHWVLFAVLGFLYVVVDEMQVLCGINGQLFDINAIIGLVTEIIR